MNSSGQTTNLKDILQNKIDDLEKQVLSRVNSLEEGKFNPKNESEERGKIESTLTSLHQRISDLEKGTGRSSAPSPRPLPAGPPPGARRQEPGALRALPCRGLWPERSRAGGICSSLPSQGPLHNGVGRGADFSAPPSAGSGGSQHASAPQARRTTGPRTGSSSPSHCAPTTCTPR